MAMKVIEVTARGFDGATDETDDRVLWIKSFNAHVVQAYLNGFGVPYASVVDTDLDPQEVAHDCLPTMDDLMSKLFGFVVADMRAALERIGNDASVSALDFPRIARAALEVSK